MLLCPFFGTLAGIALGQCATPGVQLQIFNNTALAGTPMSTRTVPELAAAFDAMPKGAAFSAELTSTLTANSSRTYRFLCNFSQVTLAYLHVDDHLVCESGINAPSGSVTTLDQPLPVHRRTQWPVRLSVVFNGSFIPPGSEPVSISVSISTQDNAPVGSDSCPAASAWEEDTDFWGHDLQKVEPVPSKEACCALCAATPGCKAVTYDGPGGPFAKSQCCNLKTSAAGRRAVKGQLSVLVSEQPAPVPQAQLCAGLAAVEQRRHDLQRRLASGWGAWYQMDFLKHVLLPEGQVLTLTLCNINTGTCNEPARSGVNHAPAFRLGPHAVDRSYGQMFVAHERCNVSLEFGGGDDLLFAVAPVSGCTGYAAVASGGGAWYRQVDVDVLGADSGAWKIVLASPGLRTSTLHASFGEGVVPNGSLPLPAPLSTAPHIAVALPEGGADNRTSALGLCSGPSVALCTSAQLQARLQRARAAELSKYASFGALAETKKAVQAAVMWTSVWSPLEQGPLANIIRGNPFSLDQGYTNDDWAMVIFDWDNTFASYMLSLDSKELAYSALLQVVKSRTAEGFVPNWATPVAKRTWSQPPIAGRVLLEIFKRSNRTGAVDKVDMDAIELLLDDLIDWNDWFYANRRLPPLNITCLGGPTRMQEARWESGLDNSPMYDDWQDDFANGKMQLYDVGMASMHVMDTDALVELAEVAGRTADAGRLRARADTMRQLVDTHLWDDASGAYVNRLVNGTFYRHLSPTSFYPMLVKAPSDTRVEQMVKRWLMNSSRFCISPGGDFVGNSDDCYWGLPSISADDPAFPKLGYWRGFVWGPMAMLTWWGLREYDRVPAALQARQALARQMNTLMLTQWQMNGDICENYSPKKDAVECTGQPFYHWGALTGFLSLLEAGHY